MRNVATILVDHRSNRSSGDSAPATLQLRDLGKPRGLISRYEEPIWRFETGRIRGLDSIRWDRRLHDGSRLTDPAHAGLLDTARRFLTILLNDPLNMFEIDGHATAIHRTYTLLSIMNWAVSLGYSRLSEIRPSDWEAFKASVAFGLKALIAGTPPKRKDALTDARILEIFRVFQHLYDFGESRDEDGAAIIADGLGFQPFEFAGDAIKLARAKGAETGRTPTIPSPIALHYLDAAIQYVAYYSEDIIQLNRRVEDLAKRPHQKRRRSPGEFYAELASLLIKVLDGTDHLPMRGKKVLRSALANRLGGAPTQMSQKACSRLLGLYEEGLQVDGLERVMIFSALRADLGQAVGSQSPESPQGKLPRDAAKQIGLPFTGKPGGVAPWPITTVGSGRFNRGKSLEAVTADLWSAIFIIIGSFMADRIMEIVHTDTDCIVSGLDGPYFKNPLFKDTNANSGISNARPCIDIVVMAVNAAKELGRSARERTGSNKLFMSSHGLGDSVPDETTIRGRLRAFGQRINVPQDDLGEIWMVSPHELRRFFTQAWVWYYELGAGLDALRQHLRQIDLHNAIHYAASTVQGEALGEEQRELTARIMERSLIEGLEVEGPFGRRLLKLAARLRVSVVGPDELVDAIRRHIDHRQLSLHPMPWGYCAWSKQAILVAKCATEQERKSGRARPQGRKKAEVCGGACGNFLFHSVFRPFWAGALERHSAVARRKNVPAELRHAARDGARIARKYFAEED